MDGLTTKIINGNKIALNLVKTLVTTPMLINIEPKQGAVYSLPLEVETNQKSAHAEVSESLVISSDKKQTVADNVAPGSKSWNLSGYIPGNKAVEISNHFTPFVIMNTDILWQWFQKGAVLIFKDSNAHVYERVVINELTTSQQKDCANKTPFSMTIKEINVLETILTDKEGNEINSRSVNSQPIQGSADGDAVTAGTVISQSVDNSAA